LRRLMTGFIGDNSESHRVFLLELCALKRRRFG